MGKLKYASWFEDTEKGRELALIMEMKEDVGRWDKLLTSGGKKTKHATALELNPKVKR